MSRGQFLGLITFVSISLAIALVIAARQWEFGRQGALRTAASSTSNEVSPGQEPTGQVQPSEERTE